ncbi:GNAT family N-acetyltransferase [Flexivirga sp. ID2601S]|uniref:GNAT family N-acetyltransferase n=1 Tax=Flexivirga aerilata TaxID=1656889 RepID=A0A849AND9_9MICO|nr:GNAT family N-acetyltransferase [Flexivirga aerilata]NNG40911.1 GNAT family N-acetyltransferase [Flexivirga aerilata]
MARVDRVAERDWARMRAVRLRALADAPAMFGSDLAREEAFDEAEWRRRAARPVTFLVSVDGDDAGMAGVFDFDGAWCVMGMWLAPQVRGTGIVDELLCACADFVRERGADRVALAVMEDNPAGIRAYARNGFVATGEREHVRDGRDELWMVKDLR